MKLTARAFAILTLMFSSLFAMADLPGSYHGTIRSGTLANRQVVLHVREVTLVEGEKSLIASLGVSDEQGKFEGGLRYLFRKHVAGENVDHGFFLIEKEHGGSTGTQVISLEVRRNAYGVHALLLSNVLLSNGDVLESEFDLGVRA